MGDYDDAVANDAVAIWRREPMEAIVPIKVIHRIAKWVGDDQHA